MNVNVDADVDATMDFEVYSPELFADDAAAAVLNSNPCSQNSEASKPVLFEQVALNDLIRELELSQRKSELLASRL